AGAHCNLGLALRDRGDFAEALVALRRGHALGSARTDWRYPSAQWVQQCQRLLELDGWLPAVLKGDRKPAGAAEAVASARLGHRKKLYAASCRLYAEAFAADPKLAADLATGYRYAAASAAALAAAGQGKEADTLGDKDKPRLRQQALGWLRADLAAWSR